MTALLPPAIEQNLYKTHQQVFDKAGLSKHNIWQQVFYLMPFSDVAVTARKIVVYADFLSYTNDKNHLILSYFIEKIPDNHLDTITKHRRADFLWQENCLECFIEYNEQDAYFESNVALDGRYNLYHFDNYRTPNSLPPRWADSNDIDIWLIKNSTIVDDFYAYHVCLDSHKTAIITKLNPTVILYQNKVPVFYANCHANPPDFHNKAYWQTL